MDGLKEGEKKMVIEPVESNSVLYITYDGLTSPLGQSQIIPYVVELGKLGYQYTILSFEKGDEYIQHRHTIAARLQESNISWIPLTFTSKPPLLSKYYDLARMRFTSKKLYRQRRFQIIHCRSYLAAQMGLMLKKKFGCKFLFDMRGFWVDERVDGNLWRLDNPFYKRLYHHYKKIEKSLLRGADHIITLTKNGQDELIRSYGVSGGKISIVPCCVDTDFFNPQRVSANAIVALKNEMGLNADSHVLTYIGKLGTWYLLEEMLDFYREFKNTIPNATFLLLVDYDLSTVREWIQKEHADLDGIILKKITRNDVPLYLSLSDTALFFIKPAYSKIGSSPIKLAELMSLGIPVVCNGGVGDIDLIFEDQKLGSLVHKFSPQEYKQAIENILSREFDHEYIRGKALAEFSVVRGVERYSSVYKALIDASAN